MITSRRKRMGGMQRISTPIPIRMTTTKEEEKMRGRERGKSSFILLAIYNRNSKEAV
jgi:hypothetical protein